MGKDKKMSLEEHLETANDLAIAAHYLQKIFCRCQKHYPKSGPMMKLLNKISKDGIVSKIKNTLDIECRREISTEEEYEKYGRIYSDLDVRYKKITETA